MTLTIRTYEPEDVRDAARIWNDVVEAGDAFPQIDPLASDDEADAFFRSQSHVGIAVDDETGRVLGLYILHPNNVGRCGHIANASYAVDEGARGRHVGEALVRDCMRQAAELGFRILQFNAVVATNIPALRLYDKLGFTRLGTIPGGFHAADGTWRDIILFYHEL